MLLVWDRVSQESRCRVSEYWTKVEQVKPWEDTAEILWADSTKYHEDARYCAQKARFVGEYDYYFLADMLDRIGQKHSDTAILLWDAANNVVFAAHADDQIVLDGEETANDLLSTF